MNCAQRGAPDATGDQGGAIRRAGERLKNLTISAASVGQFPQFDLLNPTPNKGDQFGNQVVALRTDNIVVTDPVEMYSI